MNKRNAVRDIYNPGLARQLLDCRNVPTQIERNEKAFIAMEFLDGLTLKHCIGGNAIQVMGG
jgi:hypothetical protein